MQTFTKIQVATKSLFQAKDAFLKGDYISSTILAGAAQQIVRDICKSRGIEPTIKIISDVSGHPGKLVHELVTDAYNKMKHADLDPNELVEVSSDEPQVLMTLAVTDLIKLREIKEHSELVGFVEKFKASQPPSPT